MKLNANHNEDTRAMMLTLVMDCVNKFYEARDLKRLQEILDACEWLINKSMEAK